MCESWGTVAGLQYSSGTGSDPQYPYLPPNSKSKKNNLRKLIKECELHFNNSFLNFYM